MLGALAGAADVTFEGAGLLLLFLSLPCSFEVFAYAITFSVLAGLRQRVR